MYVKRDAGPVEVILPNGQKLNRSDLPPKNVTRWIARHKKAVVDAVVHGLITRQEANEWYGISEEELISWFSLAQTDGARALRATALHHYRKNEAN